MEADLCELIFKDENLQYNIVLQAIMSGKLEIAKVFLKDLNLNKLNEIGLSLLFHAAHGEHTELVRLLLDQGLDPNHSGIYPGIKPLHGLKNETISKMLLDSGANINIKDGNGNTPLHYASMMKNISMVHFLLSCGASPDLKNHMDQTATDLGDQEISDIIEQYENGSVTKKAIHRA